MKRMAVLLICAVLCFSCLGETALTVNGKQISVGEADAWMLTVRDSYADVCQYYSRFLGIDYWSLKYSNGMTVWESVKADAFTELLMLCVFEGMAADEGICLSAEERKTCSESAAQRLETQNDCKVEAGDLAAVYELRLLADKVYSLKLSYLQIDTQSVIASVNRDEYVAYSAEYLCAPYYVYEDSAESKVKTLSELESLAGFEGAYSDVTRIHPYLLSGSLTLSKDSTDVDSTLLNAVKGLEPGEVSAVTETDFGLFILRVTSADDSALYDAAVEQALRAAREAAYKTEYNRLLSAALYEINAEYWDKLTP